MYEQHNQHIVDPNNPQSQDRTLVKNQTIASNLKREMTMARMVSLGLVPGNSNKNYWKAYNDTIKIDLNCRKNYERHLNPKNHRPINESYAGV